jgi:hypothetical protein
MRYSTSATLAILLLSVVISPVFTLAQTTKAESISLDRQSINQPAISQLSPFNLAYLIYQGGLKDQGIPGSGALINALEVGSITTQDVMKAAIQGHLLLVETLNDQGYRFALEYILQGF